MAGKLIRGIKDIIEVSENMDMYLCDVYRNVYMGSRFKRIGI